MRMRKIYTLILFGLISLQSFADIPSYCLDNPTVAAYFAEPEYNPNDYSYTYITKYCYDFPWDWKNRGNGERLDQPLPAKVNLAASLSAAGKLYVDEDANYSDPLVLSVAAGTQSINVYNLIPNRTYNWKVVDDATSTIVESGQFKTTGHVRMLKIDGIFNVRDMGGYPTMGGTTMKYGKIIRGSRLNINNSSEKIITDAGIAELRRLGILAELDMRNTGNAPMEKAGESRHSYLGTDIPIANIDNAYNSRIATFADAPQSIMGIKQMIAWFKEDRPVYLHCSVGADRTGTVAYLVGALCGMSEDALARDFELTSFSGDSVDNEADPGTWEILVRQRTNVGRLDKCSQADSYKFSDMVAKIKSFEGATFQRKVYNHLREGVQGTKISEEDLAFLIKYLTGHEILSGFDVDVDTIKLEVGKTHKLQINPKPAGLSYSDASFKSTSKYVATVAQDGTVTAVGGGQASILVVVDGIEKYVPVVVPITEESVMSLTIENNAVSSYMTETHYSADDYSVSTVANYLDIPVVSNRADWPSPVTIKWMVNQGAQKQQLRICENPTFMNNIVEEELLDTDSIFTIDALIPQKLYYFKVTAMKGGEKVTLVSSAFKVSGSAKMIQVRSIYNVRDLGGWIGKVGSTPHQIKCGVLYRGSRLKRNIGEGDGKAMISNDDNKILKALGVKAELDLRSDNETNASGSTMNSMLYKFKRVPNAIDCQGANVLNGDAYVVALQKIIEWLRLEKNGAPAVPAIYMSGSLGAERTGTLAFLINGLLGVSEEDLSKDYELSSFSGDKLESVLCQRNTGNFPVMVAAIKSLNGQDLQHKIYKYFKEGVGGTAISESDLNWFISYMLDCPVSEIEGSYLTEVEIAPAAKVTGKIYNLLGQEVTNPGPGAYIMDGKKFIIRD